MSGVAPSVYGDSIVQAGIRIRLWKPACQQVRQFGVEVREIEAESPSGFGWRHVPWFSGGTHAASLVLVFG